MKSLKNDDFIMKTPLVLKKSHKNDFNYLHLSIYYNIFNYIY